MISPTLFHTANTLSGSLRSPPSPRGEGFDTEIPLPSIQPPPLRGTSFHRKEGVSTRAPSLGRGCRAPRGGVGFLFWRRSRLLFPFPLEKGIVSRKRVSSYRSLPPWGRGTASAVDRVLSQAAHLRRSSSLFFIPLVPYPARFARHLPHRGRLCFGEAASSFLHPSHAKTTVSCERSFFCVLLA